MNNVQFRQEFCCEFVDEATAVIPLSLIESCIDPDLKQQGRMFKDRATYVGIDFGKKRDSTVVTFFEKTQNDEGQDVFTLKRMDSYLEPYESQLKKIETNLKNMNAMQVWVDQTGVGEKLYEDMNTMSRSWHVNGVIFSRQWKERAVNDVILLMQAGRVKFMKDDELIKQVHGLQRKITVHGNVRFEHQKNEHDDIFWSIALALSQASHNSGFFGMTGTKILM